MAEIEQAAAIARALNKVRQYRQYRPEPLSEETLQTLLEIARWTGSSRNSQPWHFIVVTDKARMKELSAVREAINWVATAPAAIALVLNGANQTSESYDEGRVTERLLIGAHLLGLGGGTAWYGDDDQQRRAKEILGIPAERSARSLVALGYTVAATDPRPGAAPGGRKPLGEIVSHEQFGKQ
jgi:nitroreductase